MLNLVSQSATHFLPSGPRKVFANLAKGLKEIGYPFVVNRSLDATSRLWIHDDLAALAELDSIDPATEVVVGPNLVVLPRQLPSDVDLSRAVYIQPSRWTKEFFETFGFDACPVVAWPAGIDTSEFHPGRERRTKVLVYFKQRLPEELDEVQRILRSRGAPFEVLMYPGYSQRRYRGLLAESRFVIWLGRQESQGIALQEALATDTPVLVWDVKRLGHWQAASADMAQFTQAENDFPATSAEYFDERCGVRVHTADELPAALDEMERRLDEFAPRKFVLDELSLAKQARDFVAIYDTHFGEEDAASAARLREGNWVNRRLDFRAAVFRHDATSLLRSKLRR